LHEHQTNESGGQLNDPWSRLETLLETGGRQLYALLVRLTLRNDVADDLLQELVIRLSRSDGFRRANNPLLYARRVAIHLAFDWRRHGKRLENAIRLVEEPAAAPTDCLGAVIASEEYEQILAGMKELSPLCRTCLVLHYVEHHSYAEIAGQLGKTPHQVRAVCHKGIRQLQRLLGVPSKEGERK
jgi:RNA polymerase sigma factor (sigma-70 family)